MTEQTEETADMASGRIAIGVDVGGSGIKAAVVDVESGRLRSERLRVPTPTPSTPDAVLASISRLVKRLVKSSGLGDSTPIGIGLPGVTIDGRLMSAANIDPAWIEFPVVERMGRLLKRPVAIINDADAAGIAEMRFGVGKDQPGVVIFLTLGTGVGSGVFNDGVLVPNTEFGHLEIRGREAERRSAAVSRTRRGLSWKAWTIDLDEHLDRIHQLMWPNLIDHRRRRQQERRPLHPAADRALPGRAGAVAQRCGHHRGGHRGGRGAGSPSGRTGPERLTARLQAFSRNSRRTSAEPDTMTSSPAFRNRFRRRVRGVVPGAEDDGRGRRCPGRATPRRSGP